MSKVDQQDRPSVPRTGGRILIDQLKIHGVTTAFCVPGESYLAALDALYDDASQISLITCRQEGGAAMMAAAYGRLTGQPGICFVTRGPGATNASSGVHTAFQDGVPLLLLIGQIEREAMERTAFQEIDYRQMFGPLCKWVAQVDNAARLPELLSRAFYLAVSGRPGPVVLALPEDMLAESVAVADAFPAQRVQGSPSPVQMHQLAELLAIAERPLVIAGGSDWTAAACQDLRAFVEAHDLPVTTAFRAQDLVDNRAESYCGDVGLAINPALAARVRASDLLIVIGDRLSEAVTGGYQLIELPSPTQRLVHIHPDAAELGRVYQPFLPILSGMPEFAAAARALPATPAPRWAQWRAEARREYLAHVALPPAHSDLDLVELMRLLNERLPAQAILTNGAGNFTLWVHRFYQFREFATQLAPTNGAMGYGLPAAVAAKLCYPERPVVCVTGDGDFMMTVQELATAVQYALPMVILLVNNGMYGTIRMHQERTYPGRVVATALQNPDFALLATAFGAYGEVVTQNEQLPGALERALAAGRPALLELRVDPEQMTPTTTLTALSARHRG